MKNKDKKLFLTYAKIFITSSDRFKKLQDELDYKKGLFIFGLFGFRKLLDIQYIELCVMKNVIEGMGKILEVYNE